MKCIIPSFVEIFSMENLYMAWKEFQKGKGHKKDVADFSMKLVDNLLLLQKEILLGEYKHGNYFYFKVNDPKPRDIHRASVRDRIVHHALYNALYSYFDQKFIFDLYSCRNGKGTHRAIARFESFSRKESKNYKRTIWILKCDIKKCFASVDHNILKSILKRYIKDEQLLRVIESIIDSFSTYSTISMKKGIPLGNLTSQLFINIYLHEFDLFVKHKIKARKYIRYADDFIIFSNDKNELWSNISVIRNFLKTRLNFELHPDKIFIKKLFSGIDFLGWTHFPKHRVLKTTTKRRMLKNLSTKTKDYYKKSLDSYMGMLKHGNIHKLKEVVL